MKVVSNRRASSIKGHLSSKDHLPSKVVMKLVFHKSSSSINCHPSKVIFHKRSSSIKGRLPSKFVFHHRSSSITGHLPSKVVFLLRATPGVNCGCAAYAVGCAIYDVGCAAYAVDCAAYVRQCENEANSVQLSGSWE